MNRQRRLFIGWLLVLIIEIGLLLLKLPVLWKSAMEVYPRSFEFAFIGVTGLFFLGPGCWVLLWATAISKTTKRKTFWYIVYSVLTVFVIVACLMH